MAVLNFKTLDVHNSLFLCLFQVPYETLNKKFRNCQKTIDREVSHVMQVCVFSLKIKVSMG